jgi:bifunctional UDP-N-acetylglucosamine pyrophosphorylase/glucosamine-1-phosphate N-acetyltransferase
MASAINAGANPIALVIAPEFKKEFTELFGKNNKIKFAFQRQQLGTADAVKSARPAVTGLCDYSLIIPGDVPLIRPETLRHLINETAGRDAVCGLLTMEFDDPAHYGRVVRNRIGFVTAIVEARDAGPEQLLINEVNSSIYCVKTDWLFRALQRVSADNAQKEFYLTDIVKIAASDGLNVVAKCLPESFELMGINTRQELASANRLMNGRVLDDLMTNGIGIIDEKSTFIDTGVSIGPDTVIMPNCAIQGAAKIGRNCLIEQGAVIKDTVVGDNVNIKPYSVLEGAVIKDGAMVGPFARLRPGSEIGEDVKVGNFVEIKKSVFKRGAKANHLSYIGGAVIGERTNVGCGTITCNYDGKDKHKTVVGKGVFIGSDVQFVAPVRIGDGATIGAGSTITENVPANSLAIARGRQVMKRGWKKSCHSRESGNPVRSRDSRSHPRE